MVTGQIHIACSTAKLSATCPHLSACLCGQAAVRTFTGQAQNKCTQIDADKDLSNIKKRKGGETCEVESPLTFIDHKRHGWKTNLRYLVNPAEKQRLRDAEPETQNMDLFSF
jgi:hypothetical protein